MYLLLYDNKYTSKIVESLLFCLIYNNKKCNLLFEIDLSDEVNTYIIFDVNKINKLPKKFIIYNFEQLTTDRLWDNSFFEKCIKAKVIFDYSLENIKQFKNKNLIAHHLPFGWSPILEPEYDINIKDKDVDLIFLGNYNVRRNKILDKFSNIYKNNKCFNQDYEEITKKTKFSLNIHYYEGNTILEVTRIIPLVCRGVIVISEKSNDKYYDDIFNDICIFTDFNNIENINNIIKNYDINKCFLNKQKLINRLNFINFVSEKINLF